MSYSHNRFLKDTTTDTTGTTDVHTHENLTTNEMLEEVTTRLSTVEDTISNLPTVDLSSLETSTQNITTRLSTVEKKTVLLSCTGATTYLSGPLILNTNKAEHNIVGLLTNSDNVDGDSFKIWTNVYGQGGGRINSMCPEDTNTSNTNASITTAGGVHIGKNLNVSSINNLPPVGCVKIITPISLRNITGSQTIFTQSLPTIATGKNAVYNIKLFGGFQCVQGSTITIRLVVDAVTVSTLSDTYQIGSTDTSWDMAFDVHISGLTVYSNCKFLTQNNVAKDIFRLKNTVTFMGATIIAPVLSVTWSFLSVDASTFSDVKMGYITKLY